MKMIIVIVKDHLMEALTTALTDAQYRVTRIASTGGFLRSGATTMLIGVEDAQVEAAIALIRSSSPAIPASGAATGTTGSTASNASTGEGPQVTLFVVPVSRFEQV